MSLTLADYALAERLRPLFDRLDLLAGEIGRLRRRAKQDSSLEHLAERAAAHVESLDCMLHPSAGELVRAGASVERALEIVDTRSAQLRALLGEGKR